MGIIGTTRARRFAAVAALTALGAAAWPAGSAQAAGGSVTPTVDCIDTPVAGTTVAYLGYATTGGVTVKIAVGPNNHFSPAGPTAKDHGQPTTFLPGVHADAFAVAFTTGNLAWTLTSPDGATRTVAIGPSTPKCGALPFVPTAGETHTAITAKPGAYKRNAAGQLIGASLTFAFTARSTCATGGIAVTPVMKTYVFPHANSSATGLTAPIGSPVSYPFFVTKIAKITDPQKVYAPFIPVGAAIGNVTASIQGRCDLGDGYIVSGPTDWEPSTHAQVWCVKTDTATQTVVPMSSNECPIFADYSTLPGGSGGIKTR